MSNEKQPAIFISHGSPEELGLTGTWQTTLEMFGRTIPRPRAIIIMSAHMVSKHNCRISFQESFETVHDFSGFSEELYKFKYSAKGHKEGVELCAELLERAAFNVEKISTGLDHGSYVPLKFMQPLADIPTIPISVPYGLDPAQIFRMGEILSPLRQEGYLILGSGGLVHNLGELNWGHRVSQNPSPIAREFKDWVLQEFKTRNWLSLCNFKDSFPNWRLVHPTWEHFAPLLFVAGAGSENSDEMREYYDEWTYDNLSMSIVAVGMPYFQ